MNISFYNGVSGSKTHQFGVDTVANNISNINNVGYRSARAEFSTIFNQTLYQAGNNPTTDQIGLGARKQTTALDIKQGSLVSSDSNFDLAIAGSGMFGVQDEKGEVQFTRNGSFRLDAAGNLTTVEGKFVMGTMNKSIKPISLSDDKMRFFGQNIDGTSFTEAYTSDVLKKLELDPPAAQTKLSFPNFLYLPSEPTTEVSYKVNLNPTKTIQKADIALNEQDISYMLDKDARTLNIDGTITNTQGIADAKEKDQILINIKDAKGRQIDTIAELDENRKWQLKDKTLPSYFDLEQDLEISASIRTKQEVPTKKHFSTSIVSPNGEKQVLDLVFTKQVPYDDEGSAWNAIIKVLDKDKKELSKTDGTLTFGNDGMLKSNTIGKIKNGDNFINLNLGDPKDEGGTGIKGITAYATDNTLTNVSSNGRKDGFLEQYTMDDNGQIIAKMNNGTNIVMGKIALYHFQNEQGLSKNGGNTYSKSENSGEPIFYTNKEGKFVYESKILSQKLEMSNANLANALTELIVLQKGFDASAKSITTSDQMIQRAIELKK